MQGFPLGVAGLVLLTSGFVMVAAALRANPFFRARVCYPPRLITTGIYCYLRHPGYLGFALSATGVFVMLGCPPYALILLLPYLAILARRVRVENRLLYSEN